MNKDDYVNELIKEALVRAQERRGEFESLGVVVGVHDGGSNIVNKGFVYKLGGAKPIPVAIGGAKFGADVRALFQLLSEDGSAFTQLLLQVRTSDYKFGVDFHYDNDEKWPMGYENAEKLRELIKPNFQ